MGVYNANGMVNSDIINDLLSLCNNWFIDPWIQPYADANAECMFCGCIKNDNNEGHHSTVDCPVIHLQDIMKKYSKYLTKKIINK